MNGDQERDEIRRWLRGEGGESPRARLWRGLELPPPAAAPAGFAGRVTARAIAERRQALELPLSPRWARVAVALVMLAGVAGGAGLGLLTAGDDSAPAALAWSEASLAEELVGGLASSLAAGGVEGTP